jgi:hypothetical protein
MELLNHAVATITGMLGFTSNTNPVRKAQDATSNGLNKLLRERKELFLMDIKAGSRDWTVVTGNEAGGVPITPSLSHAIYF